MLTTCVSTTVRVKSMCMQIETQVCATVTENRSESICIPINQLLTDNLCNLV
ncbi:hypothetical protein Hanom_Chr03g00217641 [Helianthus anomalus]